MVAAALGRADSPAGTSALAQLLTDSLSAAARAQVLAQLATAHAPSSESTGALTAALDGPGGGQAALALGAEAAKLGDTGPGKDAIDTLLARYAAASSPDERHTLLLALANTASRRVLPLFEELIKGDDYTLAQTATAGLRAIPGDDVDDILDALISHGSSVTLEAIGAVGYRAPARWKPRLEAFLEIFKGQKRAKDAIQAVLNRWSAAAAG